MSEPKNEKPQASSGGGTLWTGLYSGSGPGTPSDEMVPAPTFGELGSSLLSVWAVQWTLTVRG